MTPVSWAYFWALTGTAQYVLLKYGNCCCGICRQLGFENYDELRSIIKELDGELLRLSNDEFGLASMAGLLAPIDKEEEFRRGSFLTHLENESTCVSHCLKMPLTTHSDAAFKSPCSHAAPQNGTGAEPQTMVQLVRKAHGRKPRNTD